MNRTPSKSPKKVERKPRSPGRAKVKVKAKRKKVEPLLDLDDPDIVPKLLARGQALNQERLERAEQAAQERPLPVRKGVQTRPSSPPPWNYGFGFDEVIPEPQRTNLKAFCDRITEVSDKPGILVVGPNTPREVRRSTWDSQTIVFEVEQLLAHLPPNDNAARTAQLRRVLEVPTRSNWAEVVMLLSTWDAAGLPGAIAIAERALSSWPDETRLYVDAWKNRPELDALTRVMWGEPKDLQGLKHRTCLMTQNTVWLEANQEQLSQLKHLHVSGQEGLVPFVQKLSSLTNLVTLVLQQPTYYKGLGAAALKTLLETPHLQNLTSLSLYGYALNEDDLRALASCPQPLEYLRLEYGSMKPKAGTLLAQLAAQKKLKGLNFKYNDLGPRGAKTLFANPSDWSALRVLDFSANEIGDQGVQALAGAELTELRWLNLSSNANKQQLTQVAARALADAKSLGRLETLILHGHPIGPEGVAALVESSALRSLRQLNIGFPSADLASIFAACGRGEPLPLTKLCLGSTESSSKPADWSRARFLRHVRVLNLDSLAGNKFEGLFACPHLLALEDLTLGGCWHDADVAFEALCKATPPPKLRYLDMSGWKLTPEQARRMVEAPLFRQLWGLELMTSYTPPEVWHIFYEAGLPLVHNAFEKNPASEFDEFTTFRQQL